jgi:hypothetical protein
MGWRDAAPDVQTYCKHGVFGLYKWTFLTVWQVQGAPIQRDSVRAWLANVMLGQWYQSPARKYQTLNVTANPITKSMFNHLSATSQIRSKLRHTRARAHTHTQEKCISGKKKPYRFLLVSWVWLLLNAALKEIRIKSLPLTSKLKAKIPAFSNSVSQHRYRHDIKRTIIADRRN